MRTLLFDLPTVPAEPRIAWLTKTVAPYGVTVGPLYSSDPVARPSSDQSPLFALITDEVQKTYDTAVGPQLLAKSENDSRFLRPLGILCYGLWPFPVDFFQTTGIHGVDERVRLDWFSGGVELTKKIVKRYAFEGR